MDDTSIIELYWKRDEQAIAETEKKYGKLCYRIAENILKQKEDSEEEMYYLRKFTDKEELISAIEEYISYYNTKRYQIKLNCMTPMEYHVSYSAA